LAVTGKVYYVGAGPGDPELITVRGQDLLNHAAVIIHDSEVSHELFRDCPATTQIIDARLCGVASDDAVSRVAQQVIEAARSNDMVVRLKSGDPLFFSRALVEIETVLNAGVTVEMVPGVASQPLFGKRLLVCRPRHQAADSARAIQRRGAVAQLLPLIEIEAIADGAALHDALPRVRDFDWVIFTSANGVQQFQNAVARAGKDARVFGRAKIAVIGPGTAKSFQLWGIAPDLVAEEHVAEGLARQILALGAAQSALLVRAVEARDALPDALRAAGLQVDIVAAYRTRKLADEQRQQLRAQLKSRSVDAVLLTSSSMADALMAALAPDAHSLLSNVCVASIGPITTATLEGHGIVADVTASTYTVDGLLEALESYYRPK